MELSFEFESAWKQAEDKNYLKDMMSYADGYKDFISKAKTERIAVKELLKMAKDNGYVSLEEKMKAGNISAGDKVYSINRDKGIAMFVIGEKSLEEGMRIVGGHIDSPRLDLKQNPLYEDTDMSYLKTHYYGGIRKYQWTTIPLAIHGVAFLSDGSRVDICIGEDESDPVFCVTDLLPHLASKQNAKTLGDGVEGEALNILIGSQPLEGEDKESVKKNILKLLNEKYNIVERDFLCAEIEVVPAGDARDLGLDRSMLIGYGQDDRVCSYAAVQAILSLGKEVPKYTAVALCVDKEEVGSQGNTGMQSRFFEDVVAELIALQGDYSDLKIRRSMSNTKVLSADVAAGYDPNYADVYEKRNSAILGHGLVVNKYTGAKGKSGCNDANAEFLAELRKVFDDNDVVWQTAELGKVDAGGGGTIAFILANANAEVVDCGVGVLSMHSPYEVTSKVDIYEAFKGYKAFMKSAF
ncbi:MAG: aminopeptidase [Clostridioides sp.]|jgi:aspartyl aminopeptidase|nr:aminopeptidase [Clostridioides sp.]